MASDLPATGSPSRPAFVGRQEEIALLTNLLDDADQGRPRTVLIGGEAGVGKSRLIAELTRIARARQALVAAGGSAGMGTEGLSFVALSSAMRSLPREVWAGADNGQDAADVLVRLASILPELRGLVPAGSAYEDATPAFEPDLHPALAATRLFELTRRLFERLSQNQLLVLVLEDLHWADESTLQMVLYLSRALPRGRLLVVGTYRTDNAHPNHLLRQFLGEAVRSRNVIRVELRPFSRAEVLAQVTALLASAPAPETLDQIFARSDGNAFFVEELVHAARVDPASGLTTSLRDLLLARVHGLPAVTRRVVRAVAGSGAEVSHALLLAVADLPEEELIDALRAAVDAFVLQPTVDYDGYRFRHALVGEAVNEELLPGERLRWNRRYAEVLTDSPALVPAEKFSALVAGYWYGAGEAGRALTAGLRAAADARRRYAYADELRWLTRVMELWKTLPSATLSSLPMPSGKWPSRSDPGPPVYADVLAQAVAAARVSGDRVRALNLVDEGFVLPAEGQDPLRIAWLWTQRAQLIQDLALGDGRHELEQAQLVVDALPVSGVHASILVGIATWGARHHPDLDSLDAAERAIRYAREVDDEGVELDARVTRTWLACGTDAFDSGLADLRSALRRAVELGDVGVIGRASMLLPSLLEGMGRSAEAAQAADEGIVRCHAYGLSNVEAWIRCNQWRSYFSLGHWEKAARALEEATLVARSRKARGLVALCQAQTGIVHGDTDRAERELSLARELFGTRDPQPQLTIGVAMTAVDIAAKLGQIATARAEVARAIATGFPPGTERYALPLLYAAASAEAAARVGGTFGDPDRDRTLAAVRDQARQMPLQAPVWRAYRLMIDAEAAQAEGRPDPALWQSAIDVLTESRRPYELAVARSRWAEAALAARMPRSMVAPVLDQARDVARALGAGALCADIDALALRAGLKLTEAKGPESEAVPAHENAAPESQLGLTAREIEVLQLMARGYSNGRIAAALFISVKTASAHVSHILRKTGTTSRTEAAALAHRIGLVA